jgi:hypothetical protein
MPALGQPVVRGLDVLGRGVLGDFQHIEGVHEVPGMIPDRFIERDGRTGLEQRMVA